jgi:hypothetical protein
MGSMNFDPEQQLARGFRRWFPYRGRNDLAASFENQRMYCAYALREVLS